MYFGRVDFVFVFDPPDIFIWQPFQFYLHVIFIFQAVGQHFKLQFPHYAYDYFLHACVIFLENLDGAFLGDLADAL